MSDRYEFTLPPCANSVSRGNVHASRAKGLMRQRGHDMGLFHHVTGEPGLIVAQCPCYRICFADTVTGGLYGSAVGHRCDRHDRATMMERSRCLRTERAARTRLDVAA